MSYRLFSLAPSSVQSLVCFLLCATPSILHIRVRSLLVKAVGPAENRDTAVANGP
jgi:hypothetical protein